MRTVAFPEGLRGDPTAIATTTPGSSRSTDLALAINPVGGFAQLIAGVVDGVAADAEKGDGVSIGP